MTLLTQNIDSVLERSGVQQLPQHAGSRLTFRLAESAAAFERALARGLEHWVVMFSGGKDSTTTLILALQHLEDERLKRLDVIYSDTQVEMPTLNDAVDAILDQIPAAHPKIHVHRVRPELKETFWVLIAGKGYPPPHNRFRWCTSKLKIKPAERKMAGLLLPGKSAILTGVRFGESDARDQRLNLSCARGGECGQGVWFEHSSVLNADYFGPIAAWRECDVWDFLDFVAPSLGYNTSSLRKAYVTANMRFGCWSCTVVRQDKTINNLIKHNPSENLEALRDLRIWLMENAAIRENRVLRPSGATGRLSLSFRKKLLRKILKVQRSIDAPILSIEEVSLIRKLWKDAKYGDAY